ncbi:MAG: hypothetical protein NC043_06025 [Muribaculaceae bacterium]|nr:hypothetical protein [Muribaculaceae bacterium]
MKRNLLLILIIFSMHAYSYGGDIFNPTPVIFDYTDDPEKIMPDRPTDCMPPFTCFCTGATLEFTFTESMGSVRITVQSLTDGTVTTYSVWTPAERYAISLQPGTRYAVTVTLYSGDTYIAYIN